MSQASGFAEAFFPPAVLLLPLMFAFFQVPGTANAFSFLGFAFDIIMPTFDENALIRGTTRGKYSLELLFTDLNGEIDRAACTGGINSVRSISPFHGLTNIFLSPGLLPVCLHTQTHTQTKINDQGI